MKSGMQATRSWARIVKMINSFLLNVLKSWGDAIRLGAEDGQLKLNVVPR